MMSAAGLGATAPKGSIRGGAPQRDVCLFDKPPMGCNTKGAGNSYLPVRMMRPGRFRFPGPVIMRPGRGDGYLTTADAAKLAGVSPATIRSWRNRGYLVAQGLDERGHPLHSREAVRAAERRVRENGLKASGIDPRQLRQAA